MATHHDDWQAGDRVALVHTGDPHTRLRPGDTGTVTGYHPRVGQLYITWDNGSRLIMLPISMSQDLDQPSFRFDVLSATRSANSSYTDSWTYTRSTEMQVWPLLENAPASSPVAASSRDAP